MEHRWGIRRTLNVGVRLYTPHSPPKFGRLLNASASGAYVAIGAKPSIMARVRIALGWDGSQRGGRDLIAAYVVRTDGHGIGIEWQDFAPPPVVALIRTLEAPPTQTRRRASAGGRPIRHPHNYGSAAMRLAPTIESNSVSAPMEE